MAKLKVPLLSLGAIGRFTKHFSLTRRRKRNIIEKRPIPTDAKSPAQLIWRHMYQKAIALWHGLSDEEQQEWESLARPRHMTGFAWFISQALKPNPGLYLPLQGGTMSGDIDMAKHRILRLPEPVDDQEAARKMDLIAVATFLGLTDTPASYEEQAGKYLKVNAAENELEFALTYLNSLLDVNVPSPTDQHLVYWNETEGEWRARALVEEDIPSHMAKGKLAFTANKLLKGAGPDSDPTEVDSYTHPSAPPCRAATSAQTGHATAAQIAKLAGIATGATKNAMATGSYTGNNTANRAIAHGLGVTPKLVVIISITNAKALIGILNPLDASITSGSEFAAAGAAPQINTYPVTAMNTTNFYVGHSGDMYLAANSNTCTYKWFALG